MCFLFAASGRPQGSSDVRVENRLRPSSLGVGPEQNPDEEQTSLQLPALRWMIQHGVHLAMMQMWLSGAICRLMRLSMYRLILPFPVLPC